MGHAAESESKAQMDLSTTVPYIHIYIYIHMKNIINSKYLNLIMIIFFFI